MIFLFWRFIGDTSEKIKTGNISRTYKNLHCKGDNHRFNNIFFISDNSEKYQNCFQAGNGEKKFKDRNKKMIKKWKIVRKKCYLWAFLEKKLLIKLIKIWNKIVKRSKF